MAPFWDSPRIMGLRTLVRTKRVYYAYIILVGVAGIVLMVLPSELISWEAPEKPELNLGIRFSDLPPQGWISLAFVLFGFTLMVSDLAGADLVMNMVLALMVIFKVITIKNALAGFANSGLLTVVVLFMVAQGITSTGGADYLVSKLLGTPSDIMLAQVRMCLVAALFSSFVNDTPVFCIMLPIVLTWAAKARLPVRQLIIPLSYCCLLGGMNTTIGTSTNLVVTGQFSSRVLDPASEYYQPGIAPIKLFDLAPYGIPNTVWGIIYIVLAAPFLLADGAGRKVFQRVSRTFRRARTDAPRELGQEFFFGLLVTNASTCVGKTINAAGLRQLEGQFVVAVRHESKVYHAVGPEFVISAGDVLYLSGIPDGTQELATKYGLVPYSDALEDIDVSKLPGVGAAFGVGDVISIPRADSTQPTDGLGKPHSSSSVDPSLAGTSSQHLMTKQDSVGSSDGGAKGVSLAEAGEENGGAGAYWGASGSGSSQGGVSLGPPSASTLTPTPPELVEATIKKSAPIVGQTIRGAAFRSRFHAAVVAIKRNNTPIDWTGQTMGEEVLRAGDQLLLDVSPQFWTTPEVNTCFEQIGKSGQVRAHNEFMVPMRVTRYLAGKSVQRAGLRMLPNAFLAAIDRRGTTLHAVSPDEVLEVGDVLWFAGDAASVRFIRNTPGLVPLADKHTKRLVNTQVIERRLVQAIVAQGSPLAGKTVREVRFREQFNAAVVAVARKGERIQAKPGDIKLRGGDIMLLDTGAAFARQHKDSKYFSIVIEMENTNPPRFLHTAIAVAAIATAFVLYALEVLDILPAAAVVVAVMLLTGCMSPEQARRAIRWDVYLMIAGSFGVSTGLEQTGAAAAIANMIVSIGRSAGGQAFTIAAIYVATVALSQIISNNSAAALVFPIAATISKNEGVDIYMLAYAVMLGASSVFMSSFGYQTNLMALAAGGHSSRDFIKYGTPLQVVLAVVSIILLATQRWLLVWLVTGAAGAVVMGTPQVLEWISIRKRARIGRKAT